LPKKCSIRISVSSPNALYAPIPSAWKGRMVKANWWAQRGSYREKRAKYGYFCGSFYLEVLTCSLGTILS